MQRLVGFASASAENANHALGVGESDEYETLTLKNVLDNLHKEILGALLRNEQMNKAQGKVMGAMCFQIMEQLNWSFKLNNQGSSSGSGSGGFTTIETF